jgi:hypothetical protein
LGDFNVKACFCVIGSLVVTRPEQIRAIVDEGHFLVNHTFHHRLGDLWDTDRLQSDLVLCDRAVSDAIGVANYPFVWFRPPFGLLTGPVLEVSKKRRILPVTHFAFDTLSALRAGLWRMRFGSKAEYIFSTTDSSAADFRALSRVRRIGAGFHGRSDGFWRIFPSADSNFRNPRKRWKLLQYRDGRDLRPTSRYLPIDHNLIRKTKSALQDRTLKGDSKCKPTSRWRPAQETFSLYPWKQ